MPKITFYYSNVLMFKILSAKFGETFAVSCYQTKLSVMLCRFKLSDGVVNIHRLAAENKGNIIHNYPCV